MTTPTATPAPLSVDEHLLAGQGAVGPGGGRTASGWRTVRRRNAP